MVLAQLLPNINELFEWKGYVGGHTLLEFNKTALMAFVSTAICIALFWIGGTRRDWRGQGHFHALTEETEVWALASGFHEVVVKTKNRFYDMRSTLDHLEFDVVKYEVHPEDNRESKVYLSKKLTSDVLRAHTSSRKVVHAG